MIGKPVVSRRRFLSAAGGLALAALAPGRSFAFGEGSAEFEAAVTAAKGQSLNLIVDPPQAYRDIAGIFAAAFPDINVQTTVMHPSDAAPRLITEQRNGVFAFDVWWGTCTNMNSIAAPAGILAEMPPYLVLPSVKQPSNWRVPDMLYTSPKPFVFVHTLSLINQGAYNADLVPGGVLTLDKLLDPSLKQMISIRVPNRPHGGSLMLAQVAKEKGFDFVDTLLRTMQPIYVDNDRQNTMSVMRGDTAVAIGTSEETLYACHQEKGCTNIRMFPTADMQARGASVLKNTPHEAAAKVFLNWLLSKDGQEIYVREWSKTNFGGGFSMRRDVEPHPDQLDSIPDVAHIQNYSAVSYDSGWEDVQKIIALYKKIEG